MKNKQAIAEMSFRTALQQATMRPIGERIYKISSGWEAEVMKKESRVTQVKSTLDLDQALENSEVSYILILKEFAIGEQLLNRIINRHGSIKNIFVESDAI